MHDIDELIEGLDIHGAEDFGVCEEEGICLDGVVIGASQDPELRGYIDGVLFLAAFGVSPGVSRPRPSIS